MEIKELYEYLYNLETNKPDPEEVTENFLKVVTENIETFKEMVCYVDVLTRKSEEFLYFNELHGYILKNLDNKTYNDFKDELTNNPEQFGDTTNWTREVVKRRKEYGFNLEQIPMHLR